ncbi:hypothetical protein KTR66_04375 [Roseococcus sp. SDR]|uniref:hypothetical protein n=1 Tax=Roseococcus sp. SDR TaxID=2835532 RepID=UPI001BCD89D4|nr:hypothetical protein [Roseococcus sp. SDR]MBS7789215.1 hypothetical protein [Roseococcus sp. SDR]MBV1844529.1 hypothetical protein [Roseococcus sp. SDR]
MRLLGVLILGSFGAVFLGLFVLSLLAGEWLPMGVTGAAVAAMAYGIVTWLRPDDPAAPPPTDPGTPWDPLRDGTPRERVRVDWSDPPGTGEATPASESGDNGGEGGSSSD